MRETFLKKKGVLNYGVLTTEIQSTCMKRSLPATESNSVP